MGIAEYFSIAILSIIWITSFSALRRGGRYSLSAATIAVAAIQLYFTRAQFLLWQGNEISKYLIPPYQSIRYFLFYVGMRFWAPYVISLIAALIIFRLAVYFNERRGKVLFENEEPQYIALGIFLNSHPGWVLYLAISIISYLLYAIPYTLNLKRSSLNPNRRVSFYYWWLPLAALAIIANTYLLGFNWYSNFII